MKKQIHKWQLFKYTLLVIILLIDILIIINLLKFKIPTPLEGYKLKIKFPINLDINLIIDDSNSIISSEILNKAKDKNINIKISYNNNQIIVNGKDIINTQNFNANFGLNTTIKEKVHKGLVFKFANDNKLPGKMLIRLKATNEIKEIFDDTMYVYIYNKNNKYQHICNSIITADNYYEFNIFQNQEYILSDKKLDDTLIQKNHSKTVTFQRSNKTHLLLITLGASAIISTYIFRIKKIK